jgi:DNA polymerase
MAACAPYLRRQLEVIDPALVVTLGRFSLGTFMPGTRISQVHGTVRPVDPATGARAARAFAMYHPAAALRQGALKETMRDDMSRVPAALIGSREERASTLAPDPTPEPEPALEATPEQPEPVLQAVPERPEPTPEPEPALEAAPEQPVDPEPPMSAEIIDTLETLDDLAPLEVHGIPPDQPPETDQMRLF